MKTCCHCKAEKALTEFYRCKARKDGLEPRCKVCTRKFDHSESAKKRRANYERAGRDNEHRNEYRRIVRPKPVNRARENRHAVKYRERYPEKTAAKRAVRQAVEGGRLTKPKVCTSCGTQPPPRLLHAHHYNGYDRPLDVIWMCHLCHSDIHNHGHARRSPSPHSPSSQGTER
jgi:hypothetical protein